MKKKLLLAPLMAVLVACVVLLSGCGGPSIADLITDDDRSEENIIPGAFDPRVAEAVANAVAKAARESGVARL